MQVDFCICFEVATLEPFQGTLLYAGAVKEITVLSEDSLSWISI
jgi:hypothetical protein